MTVLENRRPLTNPEQNHRCYPAMRKVSVYVRLTGKRNVRNGNIWSRKLQYGKQCLQELGLLPIKSPLLSTADGSN